MLPARATELARTADLHILYRRAASAHVGAITPEVRAQLWADAEKLVPPLKEKETMTDIEDLRADAEYHAEHPQAHVNVVAETPDEPKADEAKPDAPVEAHEPQAAPGDPMKPYTMTEDTQTEAERIASQLNRDLMDKAAELGRAREENAELSKTLDESQHELLVMQQVAETNHLAYQAAGRERDELRRQLDTLAANQTLTPPARIGVWEIVTLNQEILTSEQRSGANKDLNNFLKCEWQIVPQLCYTTHEMRLVFLQRRTRAVEPKPTTVPDSELAPKVTTFPTAEAEPTTAAIRAALGNGGARRVGG